MTTYSIPRWGLEGGSFLNDSVFYGWKNGIFTRYEFHEPASQTLSFADEFSSVDFSKYHGGSESFASGQVVIRHGGFAFDTTATFYSLSLDGAKWSTTFSNGFGIGGMRYSGSGDLLHIVCPDEVVALNAHDGHSMSIQKAPWLSASEKK